MQVLALEIVRVLRLEEPIIRCDEHLLHIADAVPAEGINKNLRRALEPREGSLFSQLGVAACVALREIGMACFKTFACLEIFFL